MNPLQQSIDNTQYEAWRQQAAKRMPMLAERVYSLRTLFCEHVDAECQCRLENALESLRDDLCYVDDKYGCARCILTKIRYRKLIMAVWKAEHGKH